MRILLIGAVAALAGCVTNPSATRVLSEPVASFEARSFDALTSCISETGITDAPFRMKYLPTGQGHAWHYDHGKPALSGRSAVLLEVRRGPPVLAQVTVTGGPWLGGDKSIIRRVRECAARS